MSTTNDPNNTTTQDAQPSTHQHQPLPLPEPPADGTTPTLDVSSGQPLALDHLGPMVVNRDGTLSRIANWAEMSEIERRNTLRVLGKRNALRREALLAAEAEGKEEGKKEDGKDA